MSNPRLKLKANIRDGSAWSFGSHTVATASEINQRIEELADILFADYKNIVTNENPLILVCIMNGAFMFTADLSRALARRGLLALIEFIRISSYQGTQSGELRLINDLKGSVKNKHVLICEDIVDSGKTLHFFKKILKERQPASVKTIVLCDKVDARKIPFVPEYVGFTVPVVWVTGYSFDFNGFFRPVPDILVLDQKFINNMGEMKLKMEKRAKL